MQKSIVPVLLLVAVSAAVGCTNPKNDGVPEACEGEAQYEQPLGHWKASTFDNDSQTARTLRLTVANSNTEVAISCFRRGVTAETSRLVDSEFDDQFFSLDPTGLMEVNKSGLNCRLEEMGGVYDLAYAGKCVKLKNLKGTIFLEREGG